MINSKESKKLGMYSWLLKLLSRDMKKKKKNKNQSTNRYKKQQKR